MYHDFRSPTFQTSLSLLDKTRQGGFQESMSSRLLSKKDAIATLDIIHASLSCNSEEMFRKLVIADARFDRSQ